MSPLTWQIRGDVVTSFDYNNGSINKSLRDQIRGRIFHSHHTLFPFILSPPFSDLGIRRPFRGAAPKLGFLQVSRSSCQNSPSLAARYPSDRLFGSREGPIRRCCTLCGTSSNGPEEDKKCLFYHVVWRESHQTAVEYFYARWYRQWNCTIHFCPITVYYCIWLARVKWK